MAVTAVPLGLFPTELLRDTGAAPAAPQGTALASPQSPASLLLQAIATSPGATPSPPQGTPPSPLQAAAQSSPQGAGPAPQGAAPSSQPAAPLPRAPDVVVFSSAPLRVLAEVASAGLRQLASLLPTLVQAVEESSPLPLGHLAKAAGAAARQVADGHLALLAEGPDRIAAALPDRSPPRPTQPGTEAQLLRTLVRDIGTAPEPAADMRTNETLRAIARQIGAASLEPPTHAIEDPAPADPAQRWLSEAKHLLSRTGDALDQAGEQLRPQLRVLDPTTPHVTWAMTELIAAQTQVAMAFARLGNVPAPIRRHATAPMLFPAALSLGQLRGATSLLGMALLIAIMWLVSGLFSLTASLVALAGTAFWVWRIYRATQGVTLDARR